MSLALIQESAKEVRRLAIAGSPLAVGDFRLKKLAAPLEQAGAKVPVFAQVAKAIGDLVDGDEARSAERLLTLSTLLNAILYTQGQTGIDGAVEELATTPVTGSVTRTPARVLRPLQEALTRTGGGRFEVVKSAVDAGAFHDLRLVAPAIQALGDAYPELADLVAEKVLPSFGPGIASRLKDGLDLKGKKQDARRLEVLHRVDPATALPLCKAALEDGAPDVKAAAIACLGEHEDCLPLVLEQAKAKNKLVKAAALEALAGIDHPEVAQLFETMIHGEALGHLVPLFDRIRSPRVVASLNAEGRRTFELLLKKDTEQLIRFYNVLACLMRRRDHDTDTLLLTYFRECGKLAKLAPAPKSNVSGADVVGLLSQIVYNIGSRPALEALVENHAKLPEECFGPVFRAALRVWPTDKVYSEFSRFIRSKKAVGSTKSREIHSAMSATGNGGLTPLYWHAWEAQPEADPKLIQVEWDDRWIDDAIQADDVVTVCWIAKLSHRRAMAFLENRLIEEKSACAEEIMEAFARCRVPRITDIFLNFVKRMLKDDDCSSMEIREACEWIRFLPTADLPKLDAFAATLDEKFMEPFLEALAPLRSSAPTA